MANLENPNPDEILRRIKKEETRSTQGKLKIFIGMSAGVGKTYAMLEEAQQKLKEGVNVMVGVVNTHGRKETEKQLEGLPVIPEKKIEYRGIVFQEFDLETTLKLHPQLVLVDELAHTNVPGARHQKRWQDVVELLDAGIDVYTAVNIQHLESRKETIEAITDIQIRETVPDSIFERADAVEIIDIPPQELLKRLTEGKVYTGALSRIAIENFFKEDNLTALREVALRLTAEKVEHDLHGFKAREATGGWKTHEKLMVAVSASPSSEELIRATRRRAFEMDVPWIAVHVNLGKESDPEDEKRLKKHLDLARDLGAEIITIYEMDIASALTKAAKENGVTQVIIGRSAEHTGFFDYFKKDFVQQFEEKNKDVDILILRQNKALAVYRNVMTNGKKSEPLYTGYSHYFLVFLYIAFISLIGKLLEPYLGYKIIGYIFLIGILGLSFFVNKAQIFLAALLSSLSWAGLFVIPNYGTQTISLQDIIMVIVYFCTSTVTGVLATRLRQQENFFRKREDIIHRLYDVEREMGNAMDLQNLRSRVSSKVSALWDGRCDLLFRNSKFQLQNDSQLEFLQDEHEFAIAEWTFDNGKIAGKWTDTLPASKAIYFPIKYVGKQLGVLVFEPNTKIPLSDQEMEFLSNIANRLGPYSERFLEIAENKNINFASQLEGIHKAILRSVSSSLYQPIQQLISIHQNLQVSKTPEERMSLIGQSLDSLNHLELIIQDVMTISELESGNVYFERNKFAPYGLFERVIAEVHEIFGRNRVNFHMSNPLLEASLDSRLFAIAIKNLYAFLLGHSKDSLQLDSELIITQNNLELVVRCGQLEIPTEYYEFLAKKEASLASAPRGVAGLELAIVKAIVDLHRGKLRIEPVGSEVLVSLQAPSA